MIPTRVHRDERNDEQAPAHSSSAPRVNPDVRIHSTAAVLSQFLGGQAEKTLFGLHPVWMTSG